MTIELESEKTAVSATQLAGKYLTFILNGESFAIDVLRVREIILPTNITGIPQMPEYVRGVINLRGKIIPVIDLRLRFGLSDAASTDRMCIIVVQVNLPDKSTQFGLIVDGVEEAVNITPGDVEEAPDFGPGISTECIRGMARLKGRVVALLDIDRALAG